MAPTTIRTRPRGLTLRLPSGNSAGRVAPAILWQWQLVLVTQMLLIAVWSWGATANEGDEKADKSEWRLEEGWFVQEALAEFTGPISIAFLKSPQSGSDAVISLVTEIRGGIYAVTRAGEKILLHTLAEVVKPKRELPFIEGEIGQAGACLSGDDKYLFTTAVVESGFNTHSAVYRWESSDNWKTIRKTAELKDIFKGDKATLSHFIGH